MWHSQQQHVQRAHLIVAIKCQYTTDRMTSHTHTRSLTCARAHIRTQHPQIFGKNRIVLVFVFVSFKVAYFSSIISILFIIAPSALRFFLHHWFSLYAIYGQDYSCCCFLFHFHIKYESTQRNTREHTHAVYPLRLSCTHAHSSLIFFVHNEHGCIHRLYYKNWISIHYTCFES